MSKILFTAILIRNRTSRLHSLHLALSFTLFVAILIENQYITSECNSPINWAVIMQPITEDQEWTLRRWASTVGKRPRKRDKAFLQVEKGLSEEQIDSWWKNIDEPKQSHSKSYLSPV